MTWERREGFRMNDVYYRLKYDGTEFVVCTMQWFDEFDYDQKTMLNLKFEKEDVAERFANILNGRNDIKFVEE